MYEANCIMMIGAARLRNFSGDSGLPCRSAPHGS